MAAIAVDKLGIKANWITLLGFAIGIMVIPALYFGDTALALVFVVINRVMDGLDGAVARVQGPTDLGGYLDITLDFIFYSAVIFGFALMNPMENALAASFVIFPLWEPAVAFWPLPLWLRNEKLSV